MAGDSRKEHGFSGVKRDSLVYKSHVLNARANKENCQNGANGVGNIGDSMMARMQRRSAFNYR